MDTSRKEIGLLIVVILKGEPRLQLPDRRLSSALISSSFNRQPNTFPTRIASLSKIRS